MPHCPTVAEIAQQTGHSHERIIAVAYALRQDCELAGVYPDNLDEWQADTDFAPEDLPIILEKLTN